MFDPNEKLAPGFELVQVEGREYLKAPDGKYYGFLGNTPAAILASNLMAEGDKGFIPITFPLSEKGC